MKKSFTVLVVTILTLIAMSLSVSADLINAKFIENEDGTGYWYTLDGKRIVGLYECEYDNDVKNVRKFESDGMHDYYTGLAKKSGKRYYYYKGSISTGWRKLNNAWYHFDKNGVMETGRVKIGDGYYSFGDDGKWTGKVSKSAKHPDDFTFSFNGYIQIDTKENYIKKTYVSENGKVDYKISKRDLQVIYSALQEYGINEICKLGYDLHPDNLKYTGVAEVAYFDPDTRHTTKYVINNKKYSVVGYDSAFDANNRKGNAYSQQYYDFTQFILQYLMQTKEYQALPENDIFIE